MVASRRGPTILLTGATGYVGGRLLRELRAEGRPVRLLVRDPSRLGADAKGFPDVVRGDLRDRASLDRALAGIDTAFYLVHSMSGSASFEEEERISARNFADAARGARVGRIVYLGGLGRGSGLSKHLASRQETGRILRESGVPTVEFRSSVVIGAGSTSFEIIRTLVERLPVMTTPTWVRTRTQPIAVRDLLAYLRAAIEWPGTGSTVFEIGGSDRVSYEDLFREYARQRGLRRVILPVSVLTPRLSSYWLALVTPLHAAVGRQLIDGLRNETIVTDDAALRAFPIRPMGIREAVREALAERHLSL